MQMGYEVEFLECLQSLIGEIDKKIRRGHQRLALNKAHSDVRFFIFVWFSFLEIVGLASLELSVCIVLYYSSVVYLEFEEWEAKRCEG